MTAARTRAEIRAAATRALDAARVADDGFCLTSPEARVRAPRPARVTDRDPYRVPGPAVVSVSGGRTSGMMRRGLTGVSL